MDWIEEWDGCHAQGTPRKQWYTCKLMKGLLTATVIETKGGSSLFEVSVCGIAVRTLKKPFTTIPAAKAAAEAFCHRLLGEITDDMKKPDATAPKPSEPPEPDDEAGTAYVGGGGDEPSGL